MRELRALAAREWGLLRRSAVFGLLLMALSVGFLFVACRPPDRYRLLADPYLLRMVMLPGAALLGLLFSFRSFGHEMWTGTWDGLLLLPCSRRRILAVKLAVGLGALAAAITVPVVALRAVLDLLPATGGPILTTAELLRCSLLGRALLLGLLSYLAGALAALLARGERGAFLAPLAAPVVGLLALQPGDRGTISLRLWLLSLVAVLWLVSLAAEVARSGRPSAGLLAVRALLPMPAVLVVLLFTGLVGLDVVSSRRERPAGPGGPAPIAHGIDASGHIAHRRGSRWMLSMYRPKRMDREEAPTERRWTPAFSGRKIQLFVGEGSATFMAYDVSSGWFLGCLGKDGLRPAGCEPFDSRPRVQDDFLLTTSGVYLLDEQTGQVRELHRGPVQGYTNPDVGEGNGLAVQSGSDLLVWGDPTWEEESLPASEDEPGEDSPSAGAATAEEDSPSAGVATREEDSPRAGEKGSGGGAPGGSEPSTRPRITCRGAAEAGDIDGIAVRDTFVALSTVHAGSGRETLVVCRDGAVSERWTLPPDGEPLERRPSRGLQITAVLLGPLVSEGAIALGVSGEGSEDGAPEARPDAFTRRRSTTWLVALGSVLFLAGLLRFGRLSARLSAALVAGAGALLFGPAYVVGYLLMRWRRRWSGPLGM